MNVNIDNSVWSLALRRNLLVANHATLTVSCVISDGTVVILDAVRQEVLSGIGELSTFSRLRDKLQAFPDVPLVASAYERAAEFSTYAVAKVFRALTQTS